MAVKLIREENRASFYVLRGQGYAVVAALMAKGWKGHSTPWNPEHDLLRFTIDDDDRSAENFARDLDMAFPDRDFEVDVGYG